MLLLLVAVICHIARHHQAHRLQPHPHTRAPGPVAGDLGSQLGTVLGREAEPAGGRGGGGGAAHEEGRVGLAPDSAFMAAAKTCPVGFCSPPCSDISKINDYRDEFSACADLTIELVAIRYRTLRSHHSLP
jgi:hypothetical protein